MVQTKERKKEYMKEYMRKKRAKQKEAEIEEQIKRGNINYGLKARREQFMSFEEYKRHFPNSSFPTYLKEKIQFEKENQVRSVPKISREDAFKITGVDLWHGHEAKQEEIDRHMREADRLQAILDEPAHSTEHEHYDWEQDLEQQIEKLSPKKKQKEDENSEDNPEQNEQQD